MIDRYSLDRYSNIDSPIHRRDPRVKILAFFALILYIISTKPNQPLTFVAYLALIFILLLLSKLPITYVLKRSSSVMPFVVLIAIFLPFWGSPEEGFLHFLIFKLSRKGLTAFWNTVVKSYLCILCLIILSSSTGFSNLLFALESLKFPKFIVLTMSFTYRYLFLMLDELHRITIAKDSRSVGSNRWLNFKVLANMVGVLFIRTYERGESIYMAMLSRGFEGNFNSICKLRLMKGDVAFLIIVILASTSISLIGDMVHKSWL